MSSRQDEVLLAALDLLDEVGLDALTTRRLAERLGVRPSALYRHFESKRALLDAMVEHVAAISVEQPLADGDWAVRTRSAARAVRAGMLSRRDGGRLMTTFQVPGPSALATWERFIAVLREAGASTEAATVGTDTIICYVNGFTIEEQARDNGSRPERDRQFEAGLDLIIAGIASTQQ
jgi:TetR/AcrR family tetracycline transcriptional repressor